MEKSKECCPGKAKYLSGKRILPRPISADTNIVNLIDDLDAYNGGRLRGKNTIAAIRTSSAASATLSRIQ